MKVNSIHSGLFKLDGGAMFGVVPKSIWNKLNPADENNMCTWAMRCLLIEEGNKKILIDTGIGNKQSVTFFSYFYLHGPYALVDSLQKVGVKPEEITDVLFTHLHFDHCGGAFYKNEEGEIKPTFPNAHLWVHSQHLAYALQPNKREAPSFRPENILPIQESKLIRFWDIESNYFEGILDILVCHGHTAFQMLPIISIEGKKLAFVADLIPSVGHISVPYIMAYDMQPLITLEEKESILTKAANENWILFFEHDPVNECATVEQTDKGFRVKERFGLGDLILARLD